MAKRRAAAGSKPVRRGTPARQTPKQQQKRPPTSAPRPAPEEPRTFRLGVVPGATPGKWVDTWKERMPHVPLELVTLEFASQREALTEGAVDAALLRLPLDDEGLHLIRLYEEVPVVVASADSHLLAAEELDPADLAGETLIVPRDDVLGDLELPGTLPPRFAPLETTADAIATAASGAGIVIVPMSLARLHHRKDADHRPLRGAPRSTVVLAWPLERTTPDVETFIGIVRGRTARSSR